MSAPDPHIQEQMAKPQASVSQNGGGAPGLDAPISQGMNKEMQGAAFGKTIGEGVGGKNLVEELGQSPLTAAAGGKINALESLQTATVAPPMEGKMVNTAVNVGVMGSKDQGQVY